MTTPAWLIEPETRMGPCACCGRRAKGDFVEKTIAGAGRVLRATMFSSDLASEDGYLQRADARVKVGSAVALLLVAAFTRHVSVLVGLYASTVLAASASRVPAWLLVRRVWLFVPLFTGVVALPAALSVITPGHIVVPLGTWFGTPLGLTAQGLTAAALIVMRAATSISVVVLLTITTPWPRLLARCAPLRARVRPGARARVPVPLPPPDVDHRHVRGPQSPGASRSRRRAERAFVAATAGATFGKAHALSEEVYLAMVARGYRGQATAIDRSPLGAIDLLVFSAVVAVTLVAIGVDHVVVH